MQIRTGYETLLSTQHHDQVLTFQLLGDDAQELNAEIRARQEGVVAYRECPSCEQFTPHIVRDWDGGKYNAACICTRCPAAHLIQISEAASRSFQGKGAILRGGVTYPLKRDGVFIYHGIKLPDEEGPLYPVIRFLNDREAAGTFTNSIEHAWNELRSGRANKVSYTLDGDKLEFGPGLFFSGAGKSVAYHNGDTMVLDSPVLSGYIPLWFVEDGRFTS